jgi:thioredoxin-like negative regulator of GroEL
VIEAEDARSPNELEMALTLTAVNQQAGDMAAAVEALSAWLRRNPAHEYAQAVGQRVQQMQAASAGAPGTPFPAAPAGE